MICNECDLLEICKYTDDCLGTKKALAEHDKQIRAEVLDELFNTEIRSGMALKDVYEEAPINEFDEGWNRCYEVLAEWQEGEE